MGETKTFMGISRPSQALQAMIDGLQGREKNQHVDMASFGYRLEGHHTCYGCAATWTLQQLRGEPLPGEYFTAFDEDCVALRDASLDTQERSHVLKQRDYEVESFEIAMDHARQGLLKTLFEFFGLSKSDVKSFNDYCHSNGVRVRRLINESWEDCLPDYVELVKHLEKQGY